MLFPQSCTASHSKGVSFPSLEISQLKADGYSTGIWPRGFIYWKWAGEIIHSFLKELGDRRKGALKKLEETTSKVAEVEGLSDQLTWPPHLSQGKTGWREAGDLPGPYSRSVTDQD